MTTSTHIEDYIGAIYRLRQSKDQALPLGKIQELLGFSPISIHEMITRLECLRLVHYQPYRGVILSEEGEEMAVRLVRKHRIWERFLTDMLQIPWESAHELAGELEHAAPELITERLAELLGQPQFCPHGEPIPGQSNPQGLKRTSLSEVETRHSYLVYSIAPEIDDYLKRLKEEGIQPGAEIQLLEHTTDGVELQIGSKRIHLPEKIAQTIKISAPLPG